MTPTRFPNAPRSLRVLHLLTYYLPHRTGLTLHVQRLAEELVRRGHHATVVSARFAADLATRETLGGVDVIRLPAPVRISRGVLMPTYPLTLWRLLRDHDLVHVHSPLLEIPLVAALARARRVPMVITHHGDLVLPRGMGNRIVQETSHALYRLSIGRAARIIAYSDDYAAHSRWLRGVNDRVVAIAPPVVMPEPAAAAVEELRARLDIGAHRVIGFAGRFVEEKRPDLLLRALPTILEAEPTAMLVLAGQHHLVYENFFARCAPLIEAVRDHVRFAGLIAEPAMLAAFYRLCAVLALPSDTECFGLVQVEAMLSGTPVVATDIPGARQPVRRTGMGSIVPPANAAALACGIIEVLRDPSRFSRPRHHIEALYSLERTVDAHVELYNEVVG